MVLGHIDIKNNGWRIALGTVAITIFIGVIINFISHFAIKAVTKDKNEDIHP